MRGGQHIDIGTKGCAIQRTTGDESGPDCSGSEVERLQIRGGPAELLMHCTAVEIVSVECGKTRRRPGNRIVADFAHINVHVKREVGAVVAGRIELAGTDGSRVRPPEYLDQFIAIGQILLEGFVAVVRLGGTDLAQHVVRFVGMIPSCFGIGQSFDSPVIHLSKMSGQIRPSEADVLRIDIHRYGVARHAQRVVSVVRIIKGVLNPVQVCGDHRNIRVRFAVDFLNSFECFIRMLGGQQRVGRDPVKVGTLSGAAGPALNAPSAKLIAIGVALPLGVRFFHIFFAIRQIDDFRAGLCLGGGHLGKFPFIEEIDLHDDIHQVVKFRTRHPVEVFVAQQVVLVAQCGQIVSPCVSVPLRIGYHRVIFINKPVHIDVGNVVVHRIGGFPLAFREIPEEAVINGSGKVIVHPAKQRQFFFNERTHLILEGKHRWREVAVGCAFAAVADGRVECIGIGFVGEQCVEIADAGGRQLQSIGDRWRRDRSRQINAQIPSPLQNGFIQLNQSHIFDDVFVRIECDRPFKTRTELRNHADNG